MGTFKHTGLVLEGEHLKLQGHSLSVPRSSELAAVGSEGAVLARHRDNFADSRYVSGAPAPFSEANNLGK